MKARKLHRSAVVFLTLAGMTASLAAMPAWAQQDMAPAGTSFEVRLTEEIGSHKNQPGDPIYSVLTEPIIANGRIVFPAGTEVLGAVKNVKKAGRLWRNGEIEIIFDQMRTNDGKIYDITANLEGYDKFSKSDWKRRLLIIGLSAGAGILVSKIFGGSVMKGLLIGAAAGTGYTLYRENEDVVLTEGTTIRLVLETAVSTSYHFGEVVQEKQPAEQPEGKPATEEVESKYKLPGDEQQPAAGKDASGYYTAEAVDGPQVKVILKNDKTVDGRLVGFTSEAKFKIDIDYGVLEIPLSDIRQMEIGQTTSFPVFAENTDSIQLTDGRVLAGDFMGIKDRKFVISSDLGELQVDFDKVVRICFML